MNNKINKNTIPDNFSIKLALIDAIPVIFFGLSGILLGLILNNFLFYIGATICLLSGILKVLWKFIVAKNKKNIWPLFLQMRIAMPIGFIIILISFILSGIQGTLASCIKSLLYPLPLSFFTIGILGLISMIIFTFILDSSNAKSNWIEQICNSLCQLSFFISFLIIFLMY